jgi:Ca-activated chloride channel family protein
MGEPFIITKPEEATQKAAKFRKLIESPVLTGIKIDFGQFDVYDVEPPSIPDVLADRPVIVFGKWRGKPQGRISLRGIAGYGRFVKKIDVARTEPLSTNSALRYLWARHRIAVLSDYNKLRAQDERVSEVTNLGLTYNLLTRYTSFVAIDTQIRVKNGQAVTVKQPLPLPQGVSDYAVGHQGIAKRALSSAPFASTMAGKAKVEELHLECKDELSASESEGTTPGIERFHIELDNIVVRKGISKSSIQGILEKQMHAINLCYAHASVNASNLKGELTFKLVIDSKGKVTSVSTDTKSTKNKELEGCIMKKLKKLSFPAPKGGKNVKVTISFILK